MLQKELKTFLNNQSCAGERIQLNSTRIQLGTRYLQGKLNIIQKNIILHRIVLRSRNRPFLAKAKAGAALALKLQLRLREVKVGAIKAGRLTNTDIIMLI